MTPLTALVPLQLSIGAMGDVAVGYDSTAIDPRRRQYVDAALLRLGGDVQLVHDGGSVRQFLRNHVETMYETTGGRDLLDSDVFNLARYGLTWEPSERVVLHTEGSYALGMPTLFFSRAGRTDVSFARRGLAYPRQVLADYVVRQDAVLTVSEVDAVRVEGTVAGRYRVTPAPRGQNMFTPSAGLRWSREFDVDNTGLLAVRAEYFDMELFRPVWLVQGYAGWGRAFGPDTSGLLELGGAALQRSTGPEGWEGLPYVRAHVFRRFERIRLALGASYVHTFGIVSAGLGTGTLDTLGLSAYWRPSSERMVVTGDGALQRGEGTDPVSQRSSTAVFAVAGAGLRWQLTPNLRLYGRYEFQWEQGDVRREAGVPDFVRHVVFVGLQVPWGSDELALASMLPMEEIGVMEHVRGGDRTGSPSGFRGPGFESIEVGRRRRPGLPGDPQDDETERNEHEDERREDDTVVPGETEVPEAPDPLAPSTARNQP